MPDTVSLGRTGIRVARIGLGAAPLGNVMGPVTDAEAAAVMAKVLTTPDVIVDTAPFYGHGLSERRVGTALAAGKNTSCVLSTKVGRLIRDGATVEDYSHDGVMRSFEESLDRLGGRPIDIVHVHDPDHQPDDVLKGVFTALQSLKDQCVIQAVSAGMNQWQMLSRFIDGGVVDCVLVAGRHTLLDHSADRGGFLAKCADAGVGLIVGGVFNSGILADPGGSPSFDYRPAHPDIIARARRIKSICDRLAVPLRAAAIQFPLLHPAVSAVILGVRSVDEWTDNQAMARHPIPSDLWSDLREMRLTA